MKFSTFIFSTAIVLASTTSASVSDKECLCTEVCWTYNIGNHEGCTAQCKESAVSTLTSKNPICHILTVFTRDQLPLRPGSASPASYVSRYSHLQLSTLTPSDRINVPTNISTGTPIWSSTPSVAEDVSASSKFISLNYYLQHQSNYMTASLSSRRVSPSRPEPSPTHL